ncbi:Alternative oxidase [Gracilaria domingensis]|nr:Alternative oxidase [Gracilaria domingensis]
MLCFAAAPLSPSPCASPPWPRPVSTRAAARAARARVVRAVLADEPPPPSPELADAASLPAEQLEAFYASEDSAYQPVLSSALRLALKNFGVELSELRIALARTVGLLPPQQYTPPDCLNLTLDDAAVTRREALREQRNGAVPASPFVNFVYDVTCRLLDYVFVDRPIPRFWFLETVARMPYFAYSSCLHLFSTLGWYRSPTLMNVHHAEELNEAYHLAVMESLGGDRRWTVSWHSMSALRITESAQVPGDTVHVFAHRVVPLLGEAGGTRRGHIRAVPGGKRKQIARAAGTGCGVRVL